MNLNPFRRKAAEAADEAAELRARPALSTYEQSEIARAAEIERLAVLAGGSREAARAQARADELAARGDALDAAVADHAANEVRETERVAKVEKALLGTRDRLAAASQVAVEALGQVQHAASAHDALVRQSARELRAAGLVARYEDGDVHQDFTTGGTREEAVTIGGRWWVPISADAAAMRCLYGAARAFTGEWAGLAGRLRYDQGVRRLEDHSGGLLAGAPLPKPFVPGADETTAPIREANSAWLAELAASHVVGAAQLADIEHDRAKDEHQAKEATARMRRRGKQFEESNGNVQVFGE